MESHRLKPTRLNYNWLHLSTFFVFTLFASFTRDSDLGCRLILPLSTSLIGNQSFKYSLAGLLVCCIHMVVRQCQDRHQNLRRRSLLLVIDNDADPVFYTSFCRFITYLRKFDVNANFVHGNQSLYAGGTSNDEGKSADSGTLSLNGYTSSLSATRSIDSLVWPRTNVPAALRLQTSLKYSQLSCICPMRVQTWPLQTIRRLDKRSWRGERTTLPSKVSPGRYCIRSGGSQIDTCSIPVIRNSEETTCWMGCATSMGSGLSPFQLVRITFKGNSCIDCHV